MSDDENGKKISKKTLEEYSPMIVAEIHFKDSDIPTSKVGQINEFEWKDDTCGTFIIKGCSRYMPYKTRTEREKERE